MDVMESVKYTDFTLSSYVKVQICTLMFYERCKIEMNEKKYKRRIEFQQKVISRQSEQIDDLKSEIEKLKNEIKEKDQIINSVAPLRDELTANVNEVKKYKKEYKKLIQELRKMKSIVDQEVYKKRWWLIKLLLK